MKKENENEIVLFETEDREIKLNVKVDQDTVWLNRNQMADLFGRDVKTIGKHINNAVKEELSDQEVVAKYATTNQHGAIEGKTHCRQHPRGAHPDDCREPSE